MKMVSGQHCGIFVSGLLIGAAGIKALASKGGKDNCAKVVAAGLRAKDSILKTATSIQENAGDILATAEEINEEKAAQE